MITCTRCMNECDMCSRCDVKDHQHKYSVVVEWKYIWNNKYPSKSSIIGKKVIKVMCECGDIKEL